MLSIAPHGLAAISNHNASKVKTASVLSSTIDSSLRSSDVPQQNARRPPRIIVSEAGSPIRRSDGQSRASLPQQMESAPPNQSDRRAQILKDLDDPLVDLPLPPSEHQVDPSRSAQQTSSLLVYQKSPFGNMTSLPRQFEYVQTAHSAFPSIIQHLPPSIYQPSAPSLALQQMWEFQFNERMRASQANQQTILSSFNPRLALSSPNQQFGSYNNMNPAPTLDMLGATNEYSRQASDLLFSSTNIPPGARHDRSNRNLSFAGTSTVAASMTNWNDVDYFESAEDFKDRLTVGIQQMMFVSGETAEPSTETTGMIEEIVRAQVIEMVSLTYLHSVSMLPWHTPSLPCKQRTNHNPQLTQATSLANRRGVRSISTGDLIFLIRHDKAKVSRLRTFLSWKDVRKNVKDSDDKGGGDAGEVDFDEVRYTSIRL